MKQSLAMKYNPYGQFRAGQEAAVYGMLKAWEDGHKVIEYNAPTAAGKTLSLYVLGRILEKEHGLENITFTSPQVALIEQGNLFDLPKLVGKKNYPCEAIDGCSAEECPFTSKEDGFAACDGCAYRAARMKFRAAKFGATTFARYVADPSINTETVALMVDESSELEGSLLDQATINLNIKLDEITKERKLYNQVADLQKFMEGFDVKVHLQKRYDELHIIVAKLGKDCSEYRKAIFCSSKKPNSADIKKLKVIQAEYNRYHREEMACGRALRYLKCEVPYALITQVDDVWNPGLRKKEPKPQAYFKLLDAHVPFADMIEPLKCVVLASGTPTTTLLTSKYKSVESAHPIPVDRRMIYYDPVGKMNYDSRDQTAKIMATRIKQLHDTYSRHTICHCGSYAVADLIMANLTGLHRNIVKQEQGYREKALNDWMKMPDSIFLSVRYEEGISLDGPEYPMNVICKIPFPNPKDQFVSQRNENDKWYWYYLSTAMLVQQACGRTTRGPDDFSETWILDGSFGSFHARAGRFFFPWFDQALQSRK